MQVCTSRTGSPGISLARQLPIAEACPVPEAGVAHTMLEIL
jgi:hypothetical protein